jgi:hypothetical protein
VSELEDELLEAQLELQLQLELEVASLSDSLEVHWQVAQAVTVLPPASQFDSETQYHDTPSQASSVVVVVTVTVILARPPIPSGRGAGD